jgi:hypothetical protein
MEQRVEFGSSGCPVWAGVAELLSRSSFPVEMRMIDSQLAFPDEMPPDDWRELRVGTPAGMITIRRQPQGVDLVTWGNADAALVQAWNALTWAFAMCSGGNVTTPQGSRTAEEYRQQASMPASLKE